MNFLTKFKHFIQKFHKKGLSSEEIAMGVAVGNFIGFIPVLGTHTILAIGLASFMRLSPLIVILGTQVCNPLTIPFQFFLSAEIGSLILNGQLLDISFSRDIDYLAHYILPIIVGSGVLGIAFSGVSYFLVKKFLRMKNGEHVSP